jgi:hypothetical protein
LTLHRDARCQCNIKRNSLSIDDYLRPSNLNKSHGVPAWFPCLCSYSCHPRGSAMPECRSLSSLGYSPDSFYRGLLLNPGTLDALGPRCCLELWVRKQSLRWQPLKRWVSNRNGYSHAVRSRRQNPAISRWFLGRIMTTGCIHRSMQGALKSMDAIQLTWERRPCRPASHISYGPLPGS